MRAGFSQMPDRFGNGWGLGPCCSHGILIERFGSEETFKGHLIQPPAMGRDNFNYIWLLRVPSGLTWNAVRDGASTPAWGVLQESFLSESCSSGRDRSQFAPRWDSPCCGPWQDAASRGCWAATDDGVGLRRLGDLPCCCTATWSLILLPRESQRVSVPTLIGDWL